MPKVYLSLGTNIGDRHSNLELAIQHISELTEIAGSSKIYETAPWGVTDQPDFLNMCVITNTELSLRVVHQHYKAIESKMGRVKNEKWGPRLIDIDIIFYDDVVINTDSLTVPHRYMQDRLFVLEPLAEIAPDKKHPVFDKTVQQLLVDKQTTTA